MKKHPILSPFARKSDALGWVLCLLVPALAFFFLQDADGLRLTSESFTTGAWYQLWTGHLLHFTYDHFLWDAVMFAFLALLLWREERWCLWAWLLLVAPLLSILLFYLDPALTEYRGLSALDSMLYARVCCGLCSTGERWQRVLFGLLPLLGFLGKVLFELLTGTTLFVSDLGVGVVPLPLAHLLGFLAGSLWALWTYRRFICSKRFPRALMLSD
ncbi:hypothetical protein QEH52_03880 [Coraliomargarita sp. SDUM461003]|uniref:Peptidase S54 rhomboid domain-containing protein n=1 Tax=Thalassobacterium maritimum TaxID=3041265 RepID=A0ABU1ATS1_9BACT|nr:hypothetical protein [Coraliomargarita sp. SDUM461003]MDQ8206634.1 hypothetical protein [Coraliomargarita sp. SDUM461003]